MALLLRLLLLRATNNFVETNNGVGVTKTCLLDSSL